MNACQRCGAVMSAWEVDGCSCAGPKVHTNREILYALAALSPDRRFCWAGKGLYGLYRHGPLPGPRNLEEVARVVLVAAGEALNYEVVDFCLKQLGYRYSIASLRNSVSRSATISWDWYGTWNHPRGADAEFTLRVQIPVVPLLQEAAWEWIRKRTAQQIAGSIAQRAERLRALADPNRFGMNWEG
jgi:hypothetical protein